MASAAAADALDTGCVVCLARVPGDELQLVVWQQL